MTEESVIDPMSPLSRTIINSPHNYVMKVQKNPSKKELFWDNFSASENRGQWKNVKMIHKKVNSAYKTIDLRP